MKNTKRVLAVISVIALIALAGYLLSRPSVKPQYPANSENSPTILPTTTTTGTVDITQIPMENRYASFASEAQLSEVASSKRVLFFYANWCPTCIPVDKELEQRKTEIPSDTTIIRVNYNDTQTSSEEKALAAKYGITYQHTFVLLDSEGKALKKWNGGGLDTLITKLD